MNEGGKQEGAYYNSNKKATTHMSVREEGSDCPLLFFYGWFWIPKSAKNRQYNYVFKSPLISAFLLASFVERIWCNLPIDKDKKCDIMPV